MAKADTNEKVGGILYNLTPTGSPYRLANTTLYIPGAIFEGVTLKTAGQLEITPEMVKAIQARKQAVHQLQNLVTEKKMAVVGFELKYVPGPVASGAAPELQAAAS
jgi:hypothetical protein